MDVPALSLPNVTYADLFKPDALRILTQMFYESVRQADPPLFARWNSYESNRGNGLDAVEVSNIIESMAVHLSTFVSNLFGIQRELETLRTRIEHDQAIYLCKKEFLVRRVLKKYASEQSTGFDREMLHRTLEPVLRASRGEADADEEWQVASVINALLEHDRYVKVGLPPESCAALLRIADACRNGGMDRDLLPASSEEPAVREFLVRLVAIFEQWLAACYYQQDSRASAWTLFHVPGATDYHHLVETVERQDDLNGVLTGPPERYRRREGFDLTDERFSARRVDSEVDYCILCHQRQKDSCSHGFPDGEAYKRNPLGFELKGCPLGQKISESHELRAKGEVLGALAVILIDNPMLPGTGHRICNDCMKACIYQKQDPVNIPQVETRILTDVLDLPWGFEIYSLLTRWNPLNIKRPFALPYNGMNILIVGMGPAGYTLAHYLLNEGFGVVGIDGLKIEPFAREVVGEDGTPVPVKDFSAVQKKLSARPLAGFGGVSEYGITVRWDKNFLTVIHLNLLRRAAFALFDGVRFGGTLTLEDAWRYGFDHVCIAAGAGKPTFVRMKNNLIRGIRKASDFLMALQLTGAGKRESMVNLQVRLPAIVIGGGLTAIDTATELMAYYPVQVTKVKERFTRLAAAHGRDNVVSMLDREERAVLEEFLVHADAVEAERERARREGEKPNFIPLLRGWGGVKIYYRKSMQDSPAYRLNHEEIIKAFEEGIGFVEGMSPLQAVPDEHGALRAMVFEKMVMTGGKWKPAGHQLEIPARTAMIAAGTVPNVMYEREHPGTFALDDRDEFFLAHRLEDGELRPAPGDPLAFFTSYRSADGRTVTFYGDNHPAYAGNVVKAMASAKNGFPKIVSALTRRRDVVQQTARDDREREWSRLASRLRDDLTAHVVAVHRLTPTITEIVVCAPKACREFQPGQFYRLQNYEVDSPVVEGTLLMMEGVALTGAWVDRTKGEIGMIALEVGASSRLCSSLKPGQHVVVMGPTGTPTEVGKGETALLLGGGLGNAVLFSIGRAFREKGGKVIYFAGYKKDEDFFKREWIEAAADVVVYSVDRGTPIPVQRPGDKTFVGNIIQAMTAYARGDLGPVTIPLDSATRIIAIGSDRMMAAVKQARHQELKPYLHADHIGIASINSPMQCMMKAVCAQCLQRHVDPVTGTEEFVFTCVNQDQPMDQVDFANLNARLRQNSVMEKLTGQWLEHLWGRRTTPPGDPGKPNPIG
jgi:NADPH-dependent glutamate synthase beta subunit-like oxidoreductase/NAD(P)H-flavin reductase